MIYVVAGCGPSIKNFDAKEVNKPHKIVGVNDATRHTRIDYHVVVDPLHHFSASRASVIANTESEILYTHLPPGKMHTKAKAREHLVFHRDRGYTSDRSKMAKSHHSTFVAACLAIRQGATVIAFAGMDLVGHPNFDGIKLKACRKHLEDLCKDCDMLGIRLFNLGQDNILTGIPGVEGLDEWKNFIK